jgi:hypothetical protein
MAKNLPEKLILSTQSPQAAIVAETFQTASEIHNFGQ